MVDDALHGVDGVFGDCLIDDVRYCVRQFIRHLAAEGHGKVCLWVEVDAQDFFTLLRKGGGKVHRGGGLGYTAFLVDDCDYLRHENLLSV